MEIYDRPSVRLRLKVQMLKAEVLETLLYGCVTWSPSKADYDKLRKVHHQILLRRLGWRKRKREVVKPLECRTYFLHSRVVDCKLSRGCFRFR